MSSNNQYNHLIEDDQSIKPKQSLFKLFFNSFFDKDCAELTKVTILSLITFGFLFLLFILFYFSAYFIHLFEETLKMSGKSSNDIKQLSYKSINAFADIDFIKSKLINMSILISKIIPNNTISSTINS